MFKKILSWLLSLVMLVGVVIVSILIVGRIVLSGPMLGKIINSVFEAEGGFEEMFDDEEYNEELIEIIDEDKLFDELSYLLSNVIRYETGVTNKKPDFDRMKNLILEYVDEYEEENGVVIDKTEIDEIFEELELEFDEIFEETSEDVFLVLKVLSSNTLLFGLILFVGVLCLLNYLLRKDWSVISRHGGIVLIINGLILFLLNLFLNMVVKEISYEDGRMVLEVLLDSVNIVSVISLAVGIVLIVLSMCLKRKNKKDNNMIDNQYGQREYQQSINFGR